MKPVVLVTGLGGRIGGAIAEAMGEDYTLVGFELRCEEGSTDCIAVDITSDDALQKACEALRARYGSRIESVIHLAAFYDFSGREDPKYEEVNVRGTQRLLDALQAFDVGQFVYASTMLVHGPTEPGRRDNLFQPVPGDPGAHGRFDGRAHARSPGLRLAMHGRGLGLLALTALAFAFGRHYRGPRSRPRPG